MDFERLSDLDIELKKLIDSLKPKGSLVSCTVIAITEKKPVVIAYHPSRFMYPASVSKLFIAAEVLRQVETGSLHMEQIIALDNKNIVGDPLGINSTRTPKISLSGESASINLLIEAMLFDSSNTAANVLIDVVGRENINKHIINKHNWKGSEITRKYISRKKEDIEYKKSSMTASCTMHLAEFLFLVESNKLITKFVSESIKHYLSKNIDTDDISLEILEFKNYYNKIGSLKTYPWSYGILHFCKRIILGRIFKEIWQNDAGIVVAGNLTYIISVFTYSKSYTSKLFPMKELSKKILVFLESTFQQ